MSFASDSGNSKCVVCRVMLPGFEPSSSIYRPISLTLNFFCLSVKEDDSSHTDIFGGEIK